VSRWPNDVTERVATDAAAAREGDASSAWQRALRRLGVGRPRRVVLLDSQGVQAWHETVAGQPAGQAVGFEDFQTCCLAQPGTDMRVLVSGHWLHHVMTDTAEALAEPLRLRDFAREQFALYHGPKARLWPLAVWQSAGLGGACALHTVNLDALREAASAHGVRLRSVAPLWSAGLASLEVHLPAFGSPGRRALALVEGRLVTWLVFDARQLVVLQQRFLDAPRVEALTRLLSELASEHDARSHPPIVVGWGLDSDASLDAESLQILTRLSASEACGDWILDRIGARP